MSYRQTVTSIRVISNKALREFAKQHPASDVPLQAWRRMIESRAFVGIPDLKKAFNSVDKVGEMHVFDIGGNRYRLVVLMHFGSQRAYLQQVLTHRE